MIKAFRPARALSFGVAGLLAVTVAACGSAGSSSQASDPVATGKPQQGGTLTIGVQSQPLSGLDPIMAQAFNAKVIASQFYEGLLSLGQNGQLEPALATSWKEVSPLEYTFTLRKNVKFHNGDVLNAADVVYSLERIVNPKQDSPYETLYELKSVTATSPDSVEIKLTAPQPSLLSLLAQPWSGGIVDQAWMETKSRNDLMTEENGTGPFKLVSYQPGAQISTARFAQYWDAPEPYLDAVDYRVIPDESTLVQALQSGSVDMGQVSLPSDMQTLKGRGLDVGPSYQIGTEWMALNTLTGPLANLKVREALSLGLNREQLIQIASQGTGVLASTIPPADPNGCQMSSSSPNYSYNPTEAKQLLAESGQKNVTLSLQIQSGATESLQTVQLMKQQLSAIGITLNINVVPFNTLVNNLESGNWGSDMLTLTSALNADASQYLALWFAKGSPSTKVDSPQLWSMMNSALQETKGTAARKADYQNICNYIAQNVDQIVPFASPAYWDVWSPKLHNFDADVTQTRLYLKNAWLG